MDKELVENIIDRVKGYIGVIKFIEGGELKKILSTIGDVEFEAAKDTLSQLDRAVNKREQILATIKHLQTAHTSFQKLHSPNSAIHTGSLNVFSMLNACYHDHITCAFLAVCYVYLGEFDLAKKFIERSRIAKERYWYLFGERQNQSDELKGFAFGCVHVLLSISNPTAWPDWFEAMKNSEFIRDFQLEQMFENINRVEH